MFPQHVFLDAGHPHFHRHKDAKPLLRLPGAHSFYRLHIVCFKHFVYRLVLGRNTEKHELLRNRIKREKPKNSFEHSAEHWFPISVPVFHINLLHINTNNVFPAIQRDHRPTHENHRQDVAGLPKLHPHLLFIDNDVCNHRKHQLYSGCLLVWRHVLININGRWCFAWKLWSYSLWFYSRC